MISKREHMIGLVNEWSYQARVLSGPASDAYRECAEQLMRAVNRWGARFADQPAATETAPTGGLTYIRTDPITGKLVSRGFEADTALFDGLPSWLDDMREALSHFSPDTPPHVAIRHLGDFAGAALAFMNTLREHLNEQPKPLAGADVTAIVDARVAELARADTAPMCDCSHCVVGGRIDTCAAEQAPQGAPQCPDCDQTGRHMCEGRRRVVEPQGAPRSSGGMQYCEGCPDHMACAVSGCTAPNDSEVE